jgi:hypothetical protein
MIANRWAWVPGRMAARPVYAPALVVFLGGGPSVGWYPLAPGEAWWPTYRSSTRYVNFANFNINLNRYPRHYAGHVWRQRPHAFTAVREDDFRRGRPVYRHRQALQPDAIGGIRIGAVPARPEWRRERDRDADRGTRTAPRLQAAPPATVQPGVWGGRDGNRDFGRRDVERRDSGRRDPDRRDFGGRELPPAVRDQARAQREQERLQRDAEREARRQQREAEQGQRQNGLRMQRDQQLRQQQDALRQQQEAARQQQEAIRQQQQAMRDQQERARREIQERRFEANPPRQRDRDGWQRGEDRARPVGPQDRVRPLEAQPPPRGERRGGEGAREGRGGGRGEGRWQRNDGEGRARGLQYQR